MTLFIDPATIVWGEFGSLEKPQEAWRSQFPYWEDYVRKFFASNGLSFDESDSNVEQWLMADDRAPFAAMVDQLLTDIRSRIVLKEIDVILLAHWLPDLHLGTSVTNFAMHRLRLTDCFGFAISDRGLSAPFFAFDSLDRYLGTSMRTGLLMIADQKHLLYRSDLVESLQPKNAACIIALDKTARRGLRYAGYHRAEVNDTCLSIAIAEGMTRLGLHPGATVLVGPRSLLASAPEAAAQMPTDERLICSAPFAALAASTRLDLDHLLLCRDGSWLSLLGFTGERT